MALGSKILVLGCSGSGKSTFSARLHEITGLPLVHLDAIWWKADRTHISREDFDARLAEVLNRSVWIIDGDYSRTYEPRIRACDTVFFLDYSEEVCMAGISERVGKERADVPWTDQVLDPDLVASVHDYPLANRPKLLELQKQYSDKNWITFSNRQEADLWLEGLAFKSFGSR